MPQEHPRTEEVVITRQEGWSGLLCGLRKGWAPGLGDGVDLQCNSRQI